MSQKILDSTLDTRYIIELSKQVGDSNPRPEKVSKMTRQKAIELLNLYEHSASTIPFDDLLEATKMGAAALSIVENILIRFPTLMPKLLPAENPETNSKRSLHHIRAVLAGNEVR